MLQCARLNLLRIRSQLKYPVQLLEAKYTMGPAVAIDPHWLTDLVLSFLTKNLAPLFPEVHDEIHAAFNDYVPLSDGKRLHTS